MKSGYQLPQRGLVSQQDAATIENASIPRSKFLNQWSRKTAFDAGQLIPMLVDEVLPGDHLSYNVTAYVRMSTPLYPMFDNQRVDTHFFFVPARIIWANFIYFMGEQYDIGTSINYTIPVVAMLAGGNAVGSIYDHMGLPVIGQIAAATVLSVNSLPLRAYNKIFNDWFRDENLVGASANITGDGPDAYTSYTIRNRAKSHDYFTSALPWPQKFTAPLVPVGGLAPVTGLGAFDQTSNVGPISVYETPSGNPSYAYYKGPLDATIAANRLYVNMAGPTSSYPAIYADLAQASGITINQLRQAFLIQQFLEQNARGGTRYVELIKQIYGVTSPDFRLQRAEYIGGGQSPLNITPIAQTAPTAGVPLGAIGGAGTSAGSHRASYAATEHGYIIGLISVKSELSYQQGLSRLWTRSTRYDIYVPALAGLGEQTVLMKEIYCTGVGANDNTVFGYQERWQEYRTKYSEVTGIMRSTAAGTLDGWHLAQKFLAAPTLNAAFIDDIPPMTRILAAAGASTGQQYLADIMYERVAIRPLPTYGTPVNLGRF
ncbi:major capsid protein [Blackfly microvirus SF02]|uniref:Major capsid protein n=1 Tax=Blackfly microvirus SF02 TaxID=2576452 RepID=A0A4P8PKR2_9VIRU|nr:major capsid protein [Blackfly microvirus SF02]